MERIVIVDGYTASFGGLSWAEFEALGETVYFDRSSPMELVARLNEADAIITNKVVLDQQVLEQLPRLRYIGVTATGTNNIDLGAAVKRGIAVTNVPAYSAAAVAQMVFAYILEAASHVAAYDRSVKRGVWTSSPDFCCFEAPLLELAGKVLGIVGLGDIGKKVKGIAEAFDMQVLVAAVPGRNYQEARPTLETVLASADFVTLHCPLTPQTSELIRAHTLALMKKDSILINTSRGGLVNEEDLAAALAHGQIGWACLDVLSVEPPPADHPLLTAPRTTVTPHIAWGTPEARTRLITEAARNLAAFEQGQLRNRVDLPGKARLV